MPLPAGSLLAPGADQRQATPAECYGDVCITCSDEAVPVTIVRLLPFGLAMVDTGVSVEEVSVALVEAGVGDVVLVHAKEAIARLEADESRLDADEPR
jgi:hydrogenase expression/formation protein HypC